MWCVNCEDMVAFTVCAGSCRCDVCGTSWTYQQLIILLSGVIDSTVRYLVDTENTALDE